MRQRKQPANTISDVIVGVGFFPSVLMVLVLPFGAGIGMTFRMISDSGVRSWAHGWSGVASATGIFLVWFFGTYITDGLVDALIDKHKHKVINEIVSEGVDFIFVTGLMLLTFDRWESAALSSVIAIALTFLIALIIDHLLDDSPKRMARRRI